MKFLQLFMQFTNLTHLSAGKDPFTFIPIAVPLILSLAGEFDREELFETQYKHMQGSEPRKKQPYAPLQAAG